MDKTPPNKTEAIEALEKVREYLTSTEGRVGKKTGFFSKKPKKPGFFGLNQIFFQSHIYVFINENSHVLEQLITNIN